MVSMEKNPKFEISFIGGLREIGANMAIIKGEGGSIVLDCGILFPDENPFDIQYLIPDFSKFDGSGLSSVIITHAHEDHIGAVSHLIKRFPHLRLLAPPFAAAVLKRKFDEAGLSKNIETFNESSIISLEGLEFHPIHVNHSVPQTYGFLVRDSSRTWTSFFTSDFKCDSRDPYEKPANLEKVARLSQDAKTKLLFADSTSISEHDETPSEADVIPELNDIFGKAPGRIFLTFFPSNIFRLKTILALAKAHGKKVIPVGRSVLMHLSIARDLDLIKNDPVIATELTDVESPENVFILSGCQGDFKSAFKRICSDEHAEIRLNRLDTVLYSARVIPGNERRLRRIFGKIVEKGARLITPDDRKIHVSGHASKHDIKQVIEAYRPTHFFPVHGESLGLIHHKEFVESLGMVLHSETIFNYHSVLIQNDLSVFTRKDPSTDPIFINEAHHELERTTVSERKRMARNGILFVSIIQGKRPVVLMTSGGLSPSLLAGHEVEIRDYILRAIGVFRNKMSTDDIEKLRISLRQYVEPLCGYKPVTVIHVHG
jgi:ribonuclease J